MCQPKYWQNRNLKDGEKLLEARPDAEGRPVDEAGIRSRFVIAHSILRAFNIGGLHLRGFGGKL